MAFVFSAPFRHSLRRWFGAGLIQLCAIASLPGAAIAAEAVNTFIGPLEIKVAVSSLEAFAADGTIEKDFELIASRLDPKTLGQLRFLLNQRLPIDPVLLSRATRIPMAEKFLGQVGNTIKMGPNVNGIYAIRSALVASALDPRTGLTPLAFLQNFPGETVHLDLGYLLSVRNRLGDQLAYQEKAIAELERQSQVEAAADPVDLASLKDLREVGPYEVKITGMALEIDAVRSTDTGLQNPYTLDLDLYTPVGVTEPTPLVFIVQGFGSSRGNYGHLAKHLTSYGYSVAALEHIGSNLEYRQAFLRGELGDIITPVEYLSRVLDVTFALDEFERLAASDPAWANKFNFEQVGVMGYSFGGTTSLAVGGAEFNQARLAEQCNEETFDPINFSLLVQCQAQYLPPVNFSLKDPRIKAIISAYPLSSIIFGPEGMAKIDVPTLMWAGSTDVMTPVIANQLHPFLWLQAPAKYLAMMIPGTHFSTATDEVIAATPLPILRGPDGSGAIARGYLNTSSVAFFNVYLRDRKEFEPYLTPSYWQQISDPDFRLALVRELTPEQLLAANGGKQPPTPLIPEPVVETGVPRDESILAEITRTGTLKVAVRTDSPPIGVLTRNANWQGYCADLVQTFEKYLEATLARDTPIQTVVYPSSSSNRYDLIRNDKAHLECGPNTIQRDIPDITFSVPFFSTGTQFLIPKKVTERLPDPNDFGQLQLGVLSDTTTEGFISETYPAAEVTTFPSRRLAMEALTSGKIQALASDGILAIGALTALELPLNQYELQPQTPLTCEYYGLALPADDPSWQASVNQFMVNNEQLEVARNKWTTPFSEDAIAALDNCFRQIGQK
ncbi:MAG: alpha/beta hydrolase [Cyanobacteria bacterium P01_H01_bin.15]